MKTKDINETEIEIFLTSTQSKEINCRLRRLIFTSSQSVMFTLLICYAATVYFSIHNIKYVHGTPVCNGYSLGVLVLGISGTHESVRMKWNEPV